MCRQGRNIDAAMMGLCTARSSVAQHRRRSTSDRNFSTRRRQNVDIRREELQNGEFPKQMQNDELQQQRSEHQSDKYAQNVKSQCIFKVASYIRTPYRNSVAATVTVPSAALSCPVAFRLRGLLATMSSVSASEELDTRLAMALDPFEDMCGPKSHGSIPSWKVLHDLTAVHVRKMSAIEIFADLKSLLVLADGNSFVGTRRGLCHDASHGVACAYTT